ncbi:MULTISPECIES: hypothetical protein [Prochlorococcus]|uniref:Uncharacterized protein n=1 Tax=Prochlorococcus marinus (strain SARG / CCMP1375 / SS120) TaxID=167539 RepID=Q7VA85_PROMA|nr:MULTISPECIES: hypothetical protein [Prochlorococcus]AAQ00624.1 Predicted protein [Prochlorococcus marinus subsp. marinus str. CCMP1375]KGG10882.1 Type I restriction-modification system [Prochlorococcus marinus str. LG]KGG20463.1 Type I restriction-modification system [Prochlorococcus marinus str. SS2]KGG24131.1 Type I restriction-modification system [Prochlorococcus marinus str. SS35]KGG31611.1 Type I restriction-modification system [Prochlorococcus marinus str. SS51]
MFEEAFKNIDDVLWKDAGCSSELDYIEQTSWIRLRNLSLNNGRDFVTVVTHLENPIALQNHFKMLEEIADRHD